MCIIREVYPALHQHCFDICIYKPSVNGPVTHHVRHYITPA